MDQAKIEMEKIYAELNYIRQNTCNLETFREVVKIAKENGLQRVNWGNASFEMPWPNPVAGTLVGPDPSVLSKGKL